MIFFGKPVSATDIFRDLRCVPVTDVASSYSTSTATANLTKINNWMDRTAADGTDAVLYIPNGYVAINGTIGSLAGTISGYNGSAQFRALPSGMQIICGGGWSNGRYRATQDTVNTRTSGIMWVGDASTPVMRISRHGNKFDGNVVGYPYVTGATPPAVTRARSAIEFVQHADDWQAGHATISGTFTGFTKGIWFHSSANHCDHVDFPRLTFRDTLTDIYSDQSQAKNHRFGMLEHYCPEGVQSKVFDAQNGGNWTAGHVSLTGDWGVTLLTTNLCDHNNGYFALNDVLIDRAIQTATQAGNGDLILHKHLSSNPFCVHIRGHIDFGNATITTLDWQNLSGQPTIDHVAPGLVRRRMTADVWGMDDANLAAFKDYTYPAL